MKTTEEKIENLYACPTPMWPRQADGQPMSSAEFGLGGMSLRDRFAIGALELAAKEEHEFPCGSNHEPTYAGIAARAYAMADAMLKERNQ